MHKIIAEKARQHTFHIIVTVVIVIAVALVYVFMAGRYPIALVNGHTIEAKKFRTASASAVLYYANLFAAYDSAVQSSTPQISRSEIEAGVLNTLIEDELIKAKLVADVGKELPYLVNEKLALLTDSLDIKKAAAALYGMEWENFKQNILASQAMREILADNLFLKKELPEDWLTTEKKNANVMVFSASFAWDGSKVIGR